MCASTLQQKDITPCGYKEQHCNTDQTSGGELLSVLDVVMLAADAGQLL